MTKSKLTAGLLIAAAAFPAGANAVHDGGSSYQDLRSPDARDAGRQSEGYQDLRSPDARDAGVASRQAPTQSPPAAVVERVATASDGFDWGDAGIGAAGMLGLIGLGTGAAVVLGSQRRRSGRSALAS
jgi:hypothetical protein